MSKRIKVKGVISFPAVFQPKAVNDGSPRYGCNILLEPDDPQVKEIKAAILEAAREKWGQKAEKVVKQLEKQDRLCLHDGDTKDYAGYEGKVFLSCASKIRPTVVDRRRNPISEEDGLIYAGAVVNVLADIWAQDNSYGKRVNAGLAGVQFVEHGEPLAGGKPAEPDEFDEFEDELEDENEAGSAVDREDDDIPW